MLFLPKYYQRCLLEQILENSFQKPLQVVVAPMGFGKTTLIHHFLKKHPEQEILWLSLGQNETDEEWIWARLCDKLIEFDSVIGQKISAMQLPKSTSELYHFQKVLSESIHSRLTIVIDDYHECSSPSLSKLIENLSYGQMKFLHIILLSRIYPDIPCQEMWLKGICELIEPDAFVLSEDEVRDFFAQNGFSLQKEELERIYKVTDGWMAAVYLAMMNYHKNGYFESSDSILKLIKTSIFDKSADKAELMKLSVLDQFTKEQALFILDYPFTDTLDEYMNPLGFVRYDERTKVYQFHTLLKAVAQNELDRSNIDKAELLRKCAKWYEDKSDYVSAIIYYKKIAAFQNILDILDNHDPYSLYEKAPVIFEELEQCIALKDKIQHTRPYLLYIYFLCMRKGFAAGRKLYDEALSYCETLGQKGDSIRGELYIIASIINFNELETMIEFLKCSKKLLEKKQSTVFNKYYILTMGAPKILMMYYKESGSLRHTLALEKKYTNLFMELTNGTSGEWDHLLDSEYLLSIGELQQAEKEALISCEKAKIQDRKCLVISTYFHLMICDIFYGRKQSFERHNKELSQQMEHAPNSLHIRQYEIVMGMLYGLINRTDKIAPWLREFDLCQCNEVIRSLRCGCIIYATILMKDMQWEKLEAFALEMENTYVGTNHLFVTLIAHLLKTKSALHLYGLDEAMKQFQLAVQIAEPDGLATIFAIAFPYIKQVIIEYSKKSDAITKILPLCYQYQEGYTAFNETDKEAYSLTKREVEMLNLLSEGYKNTEISEKMHIALVTVEKTLTNIYHKLGVTNRTGAVLKFRT